MQTHSFEDYRRPSLQCCYLALQLRLENVQDKLTRGGDNTTTANYKKINSY